MNTESSDEPPLDVPRGDEASPLDRSLLARRSIPCGFFYILATAGGILGPSLVNHHPAVLLAMSSRNRHLLLTVAAGLSPLAYFVIGFIRLLAPMPFFVLLGRDFGQRGFDWFERASQGQTGYLGWMQRAFHRARHVVIIVMPNVFTLPLAGMVGMSLRRVMALASIGVVGRLVFFWWAGRRFQSQLSKVLDFIQKYQWWLVLGLMLFSFVQGLWKSSRQPTPPV
jgi:hypothetical protein